MDSPFPYAPRLSKQNDQAFRQDLDEAVERLRLHHGLPDAAVAGHLAELHTWYGVAFTTDLQDKESA